MMSNLTLYLNGVGCLYEFIETTGADGAALTATVNVVFYLE